MKRLSILSIILLCSILPYAQTWIRQNPFPKLAQLKDVEFDGMHGIAAGEESVCFTTDDGGTTWRPRRLPIDGYTYEAVHVVPGTNGQVMYVGGINLLVTRDGGQSWDVAHNGLSQIHRIQSLSDGTLFVHGSDLSVYTQDDGATWEVVNMPPDGGVAAAHFLTTQNGWAESGNFNHAQIWVTTDGGQSWNVRDTLRHPVISGIHMLNDQVGYMSARDFVYKTTDGGDHWIVMHANAVNSIQDLHVVNENEVWTCLINGFIFYTQDGGTEWTETNPNIISSNKTNGIYANDAGQVWAAGRFVSIIYSPDAGISWTDQIPNAKSIMYQPHFLDEDRGMVGGSAGTILWTDNGGASWDRIQLADDENLFAVQRIDDLTAIAGSSSGTMFATVNGGEDWQIIGQNLGQISDLHAFTAARGIVVSESGIIWRTINAGGQWDNVYQSPSGLLEAVHFVDNQQGWACGWFGQILHTEDGGVTWTPQTTNSQAQFSDIHFTDAMHGWAVSSAFTDTVWHTQNGGQTWEKQKLPFSLFWHGVSFHSADTGWVAGGSAGSGWILRTNNGGETWEADHQSPEALFGLHAVPGKETAWSSGVGGNVVKYSPCTFNPLINSFSGPENPCQRDTVTYEATFSDVDEFIWTFPSDWLVFGNSNTSAIQLIIGSMAGEVTVMGRDACGNESLPFSLQATPLPVPEAVITESGAFLICELDGVEYQWLYNGEPIAGADQSTFSPGSNGPYSVLVTIDNGCEVRSNTIQFVVSRTSDPRLDELNVFPNPARNMVFIQTRDGADVEQGICYLTSLSGGRCYSLKIRSGQVDLPEIASGVYVLEVISQTKTLRSKILIGSN